MPPTIANEGDIDNAPPSVAAQPSPPDSTAVPEGDELGMPEIMNLEESGLCRSPQIAAQKKRSILTTLLCFSAVFTGALIEAPLAAYTTA